MGSRVALCLIVFALAGCGSTGKNDMEHDQKAELGLFEQGEIAGALRDKLKTFVIPADVIAAHPDTPRAHVKILDLVVEGPGHVNAALLRDKLAETIGDDKKCVVVTEAPLEYAQPRPGPSPDAIKAEYVLETKCVGVRTEEDDKTTITITVDMRLVRVPGKTLAFSTTKAFRWARSK